MKSNVTEHTERIKNKLYEYSNHPFLNKFFDLPEISEDKIVLLHAVLEKVDLPQKKKDQYVLATMLIQTALDAHDLVTNDSEDQIKINKNNRQKQLNILVGDLYSGLFYESLSKINDIPMINVLASAIKEINERKMILYHNDIHSINHLMEEIKQIESLLILGVTQFLNVTSLNHILPNWLLMKRLTKEIKYANPEQQSFIVKLLSEHNEPHHAVRMIENMISRISHTLEGLIRELPIEFSDLKNELLEDLRNLTYKQEILLEEG